MRRRRKKEGYVQIANLFEETALNEQQHAKRFFGYLEGGDVEITAAYPAGVVGTTAENLKAAAMGEHEEHTELYPEFARVAEEEGFKEISAVFRLVSAVEEHHEARYNALLKNLEEGKVFKKEAPVRWKCIKCGHIHEGPEAPGKCPTCLHPTAYFQVLENNY